MAATPQDRMKKKSEKAAKPISSAKGWKKANAAEELTLPSGEVCLVKRPGLPQLLADNVLPDVLMPIAMKAISSGQSGDTMSKEQSQAMIGEMVEKEDGIASLFDATDRITAHCVVQPRCLYHRREVSPGKWETIPDEDREEDCIYTDWVEEQDKMFIFNFVVGGTRDLMRFREQLGESMDGVEAESSSEDIPG